MPQPPEDEQHDDPYSDPPPRERGSTHAARARGNRPGGGDAAGGKQPDDRPYNTYTSRPRGLFARLRGENDAEIEERIQERAGRRGATRPSGRGGQATDGSVMGDNGLEGGRREASGGGRDASGGRRAAGVGAPVAEAGGRRPGRRRRLLRPRAPRVPGGKLAFLALPILGLPWLTPWRLIKTFILAVIGWLVLSVVLFFVSASTHAGKLPAGAQSALASSGPILTSANTILILGLDNRPKTGYSSKEGGAQHSEKSARTDTIMLWRVGGGVSRRLSIPRDTLVNIPGYGRDKINAAWPYGGPKLTISTVEQLTGIKINHLIIVDLGNFPKFINDIGGVTVKTGRICSEISGGRKNGGFSLFLKPGYHHLNGVQAMTLARTRENKCDPAYNDLNREAAQQQILNGIKSQLFTVHTFLHLPWASWDAPRVVQTDMGGLSLMELFAASQIGGSSKPRLLKEAGSVYNGQDVLIPNAANVRSEVRRLMTGK